MRRGTIALLLLITLFSMFGMGCLSEKKIQLSKSEYISTSENFDINGDGLDDFYFYSFGASKIAQADSTVKRYIFVNAEKSFNFKKFNNLSVEEINWIDTTFEDFINSRDQLSETCNQQLGIVGVRCLDSKTCAKLCASASQKCKEIAADYGDVLGHYILGYVRDNTEAYTQITYVRNEIPKLKNMGDDKKYELVKRLAKIDSLIASVNSNPLMRTELLGLCDHNDYSVEKIRQILFKIGTYETVNNEYDYRVFIKIEADNGTGKFLYNDIILTDALPAAAGITGQISSAQQITAATNNGRQTVQWPPIKPYLKKAEILSYEFSSEFAPDQIVGKFERPDIILKTLDLSTLYPTILLFNSIVPTLGNYYAALGISFALSLICLYLIYTIVLLIYNIIRVKIGGGDIYTALKRAIGRTAVRWRSDAILGLALFAIGIASAFFYAPPAQKTFDLFAAADLLLGDITAFAAVFGIFAGTLLIYSAIDNHIKVSILEKVYGQQFKEDKDLFIARVSQLKTKIQELEQLVDKLSKENFEVGTEYDVLARISVQHVDELAKKGDVHARKATEEYLSHIEDAIEGLLERKKTADENWLKWSDAINKLVEESEEVYVSNLVTIPSSLRLWALNKFVREHRDKGLIFEGDVIKKKAVTPEKLTKTLLDKNLLVGATIVKNGKLAMSQMAEGNSTISGVLTLRLLNYLRSLGNKLHMHEYESLAVIGERSVIALLKYRDIESLIFVKKEKFKEAIEDWKTKIKTM